jgi:beta-lactamase class D
MKLILILMALFLWSCATKKDSYPDKDICFLAFNMKTGTFEKIINQKRCEERFPTASTFKVPLAVIAFETKVLKDRDSSLKWDGQKRFLEAWNKDQTAASWMQESVVWFSQALTPKIGKARLEKSLKDFDYGNADLSGGLKYSWLTPAPGTKDSMGNTLKISGFEQVHFLKKLWRGELKASAEAQNKTKDILVSEISPSGSKLTGKTGSGTVGKDFDLRLGWWVGYLEKDQQVYVIVINFTDKQKSAETSFGGPEARSMAKHFLSENKLW